ncbi:hypothetical protein M8J76_015036 [Diaphorina citri]|nr:hypothetical protein M8J76_015036 [Diaphorina citri]
MADFNVDIAKLPEEIREKLAELDLELSEAYIPPHNKPSHMVRWNDVGHKLIPPHNKPSHIVRRNDVGHKLIPSQNKPSHIVRRNENFTLHHSSRISSP